MYFISHSVTRCTHATGVFSHDKGSFNKYHTVVKRDSIADGRNDIPDFRCLCNMYSITIATVNYK